MGILVKLYRKLPATFRDAVYMLFLGNILYIYRNPILFIQNKLVRISFAPYVKRFQGKQGIEVGGPSALFGKKGEIPIYAVCESVDGCNFSSTTVWEGDIVSNKYQYYDQLLGTQYIGEASELSTHTIAERYDFVISSNCLEHIANPLKAINDWLKILKQGGLFLLIVPNKKCNFDHNRPDTSFEHLLQDYTQAISEEDMTHFDEIIRLHDLSKDSLSGNPEAFKQRALQNKENRCFHHHIFNPICLNRVVEYVGLTVLYAKSTHANHFILGQKK